MVNARSSEFAQSKYRRGTILGLTVAEIFILLLFLLMLVFLVLSQEQRAREREQAQQLARLTEFRDTWEESLMGIETPEEIVTLRRLRDDIRNDTEISTETLLQRVEEARQQQAVAERERQAVAEENRRLREQAVDRQDAIDEQTRQFEQLREQNLQLQRLAEEQRILREKGQNPPCWYEVVDNGRGGTREKPLYIFNIGVFDQHMLVRRLQAPDGGAFDDSELTYVEEAEMLPLRHVRFGEPLTDAQLVEDLYPLFETADQAGVRSYSCMFFVRVWDQTSLFAKERWQRAHDRVLEGLFGTYPVRDEPWNQP